MHLFGYPHVARWSTGVHDPLLASALCLTCGGAGVLFIATDIIFVPKDLVGRARQRIASETGLRADSILISATHTHSGPGTVAYASNEADTTVPPLDEAYLAALEDGLVAAGCGAWRSLAPAEAAFAEADGSCVGTNRRDPRGPSHPSVPVLAVRRAGTGDMVALMLVCSMHPTVLHEDSTLISGDFPAFTRRYLQEEATGSECVVLHHSGASGNQSPRHVINGTTFDEAERIGRALGAAIASALRAVTYTTTASLGSRQAAVALPLRTFPAADEAAAQLETARSRYEALRAAEEAGPAVRTAECDVFGAEETLTLARVASEGRLAAYAARCMPAEVQIVEVGPWTYVAFPGELFVEYALELESEFPGVQVITLANGELQGYLVTGEAVAEGGYEASNALFRSPEGGSMLIDAAREILEQYVSAAGSGA